VELAFLIGREDIETKGRINHSKLRIQMGDEAGRLKERSLGAQRDGPSECRRIERVRVKSVQRERKRKILPSSPEIRSGYPKVTGRAIL